MVPLLGVFFVLNIIEALNCLNSDVFFLLFVIVLNYRSTVMRQVPKDSEYEKTKIDDRIIKFEECHKMQKLERENNNRNIKYNSDIISFGMTLLDIQAKLTTLVRDAYDKSLS